MVGLPKPAHRHRQAFAFSRVFAEIASFTLRFP
jgi:hypothetical protein